MFVGKDRFAQIQRFFDSIGMGSAMVANLALIVTAALEIFAMVFFAGALYYFTKRKTESSQSWFAIGIVFTLTIFTYFSIGDQIFGDHFELLEHAIFWFIALLSWQIFKHLESISIFGNFLINKSQVLFSSAVILALTFITAFAIFWHNNTSFIERTQAVVAEKITENKYKISFPFLAGSSAFESTIALFKETNPNLSIKYIYTAPKPLRLGESDGLIIYIQTERKNERE